jgi:CRP/FNR family transcriptional regulator
MTPLLEARLAQLYPALAGLAPVAQRHLREQARELSVPGGTRVFDEHQPCAGFPLLLEGGIRVRKSSAAGRELPLYRVVPGESCVISSACLLAGTPYNARGEAEGATRLLLLPQALFDELLGAPPFRRYVFGQFSERIAELMQLVEAVAFHRLDRRLAALLLGKGPLLHATHQQLAEELGSVREIVSRLLKGFAEQGWVRLGREQIEILEAARLRELAG